MEFVDIIQQYGLVDLLLSGNFGLEKENLRTDRNGQLALTPHPEIFGDKSRHPYITTDFAEAQLEMVTPTFPSTKETLNFLEALHDIVSLELHDEVLWPYSLPPLLPLEDELIHEAQFTDPEITEYREYLAHKYGKRKQLLSGVHFNFSFSDKFLQLLYCANPDNWSFREFRDQVYLKVARYYLKYSWLVIYLTGANSVAHHSYQLQSTQALTDDSSIFTGACSFRNGINGYRNLSHFYVSYNSLYEYIADIKHAIADGHIIAAKEYYSQLRLKGASKNGILNDLYTNGIKYVEIRTLDLNPLSKVGITLESLDFLHLLLVYALVAPDFSMSNTEYQWANTNQILAADANRQQEILLHYAPEQKRELRLWGNELLSEIQTTLTGLGIAPERLSALTFYRNKLYQQSYAQEIAAQVSAQGFKDYFMHLANKYLALSQSSYYRLCGFEDLELSTQVLLKEAIKRGINFKLLDRQANFIELSTATNSQLIKQASKTSLDNYATILAMKNKVVTKELLQRNKVVVPPGESYASLNQALVDFPLVQHKAIVIKPNAPNYGQGISIFKPLNTLADYQQGLELAFNYADKVIVEAFISGREYRFFVIAGQAIAILHREPANIIGDGQHQIAELVALKNRDPLRGSGYVTPLERIQLTATECRFLAQQGLTFSSIPESGSKIYLRENSNISTGGDSIDFTDLMPKAYKRIAVKAASSVGAVICGVDMMINNINNPYPENNYAVIELNFNPAIHIHTYPYRGQDRQLAERILKALNLLD